MRIYINHDDLVKMARALDRFPSHPADSRNYELGEFDPHCAGGGIRMHFYCRDSVGHVVVETKVREEHCVALGEVQSVALCIPVEPAAIDAFLTKLREMDTNEIGATAHLDMAGPV